MLALTNFLGSVKRQGHSYDSDRDFLGTHYYPFENKHLECKPNMPMALVGV